MPLNHICIHAHFYQPPRENPWLGEVEKEVSAAPFHDWNQRITRECYAANALARVFKDGKICKIVSNYEKISFNFGPTLLSWMERDEPETYKAIIESDKKSVSKRSGHGNAIAQVYNHSIMPLNSERDMETQIVWGITDFEHRFGRMPEGIWFAETAVDRHSLAVASKHGIKFTILAPAQAKSFRPLADGSEWTEANGNIDTTCPYLYRLDDGSSITIFFYDGALAHSVAFDGSLFDGEALGKTFLSKAVNCEKSGRLVHIATDGESFGHHHRFGEMALAYAVKTVEESDEVKLTNYGEYLAEFSPVTEVEIQSESSWSCAHGFERWKSDCGCSTGARDGWTQEWRAPLRTAFENLKEKLDLVFETNLSPLLKSPWDARNGYVKVKLETGKESVKRFIGLHAKRELSVKETTAVLKLMEMQTEAMKMFTSCGWFFADISGLESTQIMKYAAKAIDIAEAFGAANLEEEMLTELEKAKSNTDKNKSGADIYISKVRPLRLGRNRIIARTVMLNSLELEKDSLKVFGHDIDIFQKWIDKRGDTMLALGRVRVSCLTTMEENEFEYCLLHFGGHDFNCSIQPVDERRSFDELKEELVTAFRKDSVPGMIEEVKKYFPGGFLTFEALFDDDRKKVMELLVGKPLEQVSDAYRHLFEKNRKLMNYFLDIGVPVPEEFKVAARYVFEKRVSSLFLDINSEKDHEVLKRNLEYAKKWGIRLGLGKTKANLSAYLLKRLDEKCCQEDENCAEAMVNSAMLLKEHKISIDSWEIENNLYPFYLAYHDSTDKDYQLAVSQKGFRLLFQLFNFYI